MKRFFLLILFVVANSLAFAQTQLSDNHSQIVMNLLTQSAASIQTLRCRFVQEKTSTMLAEPSVAEGIMLYALSNKMRWEYTSPYAFALLVNGERIVKVTDGKAEVLDAKSGRMYQGMVNLIMGSASGKNLFDTSVFDIVMYDDGTWWRADMTPVRRDMKRMFSQLVFRFDKKTQCISRVEFVEASGDVTSIRFEDIHQNEEIDEKAFVE